MLHKSHSIHQVALSWRLTSIQALTAKLTHFLWYLEAVFAASILLKAYSKSQEHLILPNS